jgi:hypothetical protein
MTSLRETLNAAADLLEKPGAWIQGSYGQKPTGEPTYRPSEASCFCLVGAISKAAGGKRLDEAHSYRGSLAFEALEVVDSVTPIVAHIWNDQQHRTQAEVVQALRDAALAAGGQA